MNHRDSQSIPLDQYHGIPAGWSKAELIAEHRLLGGTFSIDGETATEPGAPGYLPDRHNWLQYRETLYRICDGVRANDDACIELAIRYIELDYVGSYSGFVKEKLSRALKSIPLSLSQRQRLVNHFEKLMSEKEYFQEFGEYKKLLSKIHEAKNGN